VAVRIRRSAARHADRALAGLALAAIACAALLAIGQDRLGLGEGEAARTLTARVTGPMPVESGPFRVSLDVITAGLEADPAVEEARPVPGPPGSRRATVLIRLNGEGSAGAAVDRLRAGIDPGNLKITYRGPAVELENARDATLSDLLLLLVAAPLVALLGAWVLGPGRALAGLIAAGATAFGAGALCLAASLFADLSALALAGAACGGLCAVHRFAADPGLESEGPPAAPAVAAAGVLAAPALTGVPHLESFALGGALAALLALPSVALAAPAAARRWDGEPGAALTRVQARVAGLLAWQPPIALLVAGLALATLALITLPVSGLDTAALVAGTPEPERILVAIGAAVAAVVMAGLLVGRRAGAGAALTAIPAPAAASGVAAVGFEPVSTAAFVAALATVGAAAALAATEESFPATAATELTGALLAGALALSGESFLQQFGAATAAGLLADLLLVRLLLVPAARVGGAGRVRVRWPRQRRAETSSSGK